MLFPKVLIISTSLDFSTDLICLQLNNLKISYLRLNRDQLGEYDITLNPCVPELIVLSKENSYLINSSSLVSVYYRAPSFLREIFQDAISDEEQLYKTQWAAFVRSLLLFENAKWMNNPADIYKAEMKPLQLLRAKQVGFNMPFTLVTNHILSEHIKSENIAIKSLDTAIINKGDDEAFIYTTLMNAKDVKTMHYSSPFFIQEGLIPKIDIRVTVIREDVIAVKIEGERGVDIDWRKYKGELKYELFSLPQEIKIKCVEVTRSLNLVFAAIDLVLHNDTFYFIEVNPTGEWAWLQKNTGYQFDVSIVENPNLIMFEWIFQNIFPGWAADRAKKKINLNRKKFEEIIIDYPDTIDVSVAIKKIEEDLKNQLTEKIVEDKAKSVLGGITIAVTAITFALINQEISLDRMFNLIAVFFLLISIGSFTFATIRAIQALNIRPYFLNEFSYFITDDTIKVNLKLSETETLTQFIKKKSANDKTITETSNYVYASFILVRNGIICFTLFFVFAIIDKSLSASLRKSRVDNSSITIDKNFKK